jgi:gamma-glutamyltranspeptidase/glutathione hydrolase
MRLREVLEPAIDLAEHGFAINEVLAADIAGAARGGAVMTTLQPETAAIFQPGGTPLQAGDVLVQPDLAKTFRLIARHGPRVFYEGEIAQAIVEAQGRTRAGAAGVGRMTLADLAAYRPEIRKPVIGEYRGVTVAGMPPPSSGGLTIIQMLDMIERFPIGDAGQGFGFGAKNTLHVMIEAMRLAFADRALWMGDADFVDVPVTGLLAPPYVASRSAMIDLASRMATPSAGNPLPFDVPPAQAAEAEQGVNTTHFSVVDRHGNVVSWTTTIEDVFGTGIVVPGYGFLLNNELTDFNFTPALDPAGGNPGANDVAAGKRPRSSMSPTMLLRHGEPFAAFGSPGGSTIINTVLQITLNLVDHDLSVQEAIDAPRISVNNAAGRGICEAGPLEPRGFTPTPAFSPAVLDELRAMGHELAACTDSPIGSVQAVVIDLRTGKRFGGADQRREGTVISVRNRHGRHGDDEDRGGHGRRPERHLQER